MNRVVLLGLPVFLVACSARVTEKERVANFAKTPPWQLQLRSMWSLTPPE